MKDKLKRACAAALDTNAPEYAEIMAAIELLADATVAAVDREYTKLGAHREMQDGDL